MKRSETVEDVLGGLRFRFRLVFGILVLAIAGLALRSDGPERFALAFAAITSVYVMALLVAGRLMRLVETTADLAREAEEKRTHETRHDALTGLPNRAYLMEYLDVSLANAARHDWRSGLCLLDIKGLRHLNEAHGFRAGDAALRRFTSMIRAETRQGDFIARIGSDEFVIVANHVNDTSELITIAQRITRAIRQPFESGDALVEFDCSAGVALSYPGNAPQHLVTNVAIALREARASEKECVLFEPAMRLRFDADTKLKEELSDALRQGEIQPWFQPQINARTGELIGLEALARWIHPARGPLSPAVFLEIAEEYGLSDRLDETILTESLRILADWRQNGVPAPAVGINLSARRLRDPFLIERIRWALEELGLDPEDMSIEVLESALIDDKEPDITRNIQNLSRIGVGVDLDDFGTGHASIATLKAIDVNRIKIDRSFITNIDRDLSQRKVTQSILDLARSLHVTVLAEGVERAEEMATLAEMGCDHIQGFHIARPMPAHATRTWIENYFAEHEKPANGLSA